MRRDGKGDSLFIGCFFRVVWNFYNKNICDVFCKWTFSTYVFCKCNLNKCNFSQNRFCKCNFSEWNFGMVSSGTFGWWARENKLGRNWLRGSSASRQAPLALVNNLLFWGKSQHLYCPNFSILHCRTLLDHKFRKFSLECNQVWIIDQDELETMRGPHWPAE